LIVLFPINVSKPFRYPSELKRLVEAVRAAGEYDETRWIEWKRTLDLTSTEGTRHIVRQILGFANRDPHVAAQWAGGYAYLVIGASPEGTAGIAPIDPEQLVSKVRPYVGSAITWTPECIEVGNVSVLVIIVEPPRAGDDIHALRRQLDPYSPGTVLVRRPGQVDQADADELAMLQRRLPARTPEVELAVESAAPAIEAMPDFQDLIEPWAAEERVRRMSARHQSEPLVNPEASRSLLENVFAAAQIARDPRNAEQYEAEVDNYLEKARYALLKRGVWQLSRHRPAKLAVQMRNSSRRNYAMVGVVLTIKSPVIRGYDRGGLDLIAKDKPPPLPKPPPPWGTPPPSAAAMWSDLVPSFAQGPTLAGLPSLPRPHPGWETSTDDLGVTVVFDPCDLRPYGLIQLPAVPLVVATEPGTVICVEWAATATNADGQVTGKYAMSVSESTLDDR
jgi:hypothetical protein